MRIKKRIQEVKKWNMEIFFFNETKNTEIYTISLNDARPITTRSTQTIEVLTEVYLLHVLNLVVLYLSLLILLLVFMPAITPFILEL